MDESTSKLYVGSDPTSGSVASNLQYAINVRADGVTIRGIGIRRYATSVWQMGSVTLEKPNATLENVYISESATTGLSALSSGITLTRVTSVRQRDAGHPRQHCRQRQADLRIGRRATTPNSFMSARLPVASSSPSRAALTVTNSSFSDNNGHGFWEDQSVYNSVFSGNDFLRNTGYGLFLEISAKAIVVDSLIMNNKKDGLLINNFSNAQVWNNTIIGNARPIWLAQDSRRNNNKSDPAVDTRVSWPDPEMPWQLEYVTLGNNVLGNPASGNALLCVEDYTYSESAEAMHIVANGNAYNRASTSSPAWMSIWTKGSAGASTLHQPGRHEVQHGPGSPRQGVHRLLDRGQRWNTERERREFCTLRSPLPSPPPSRLPRQPPIRHCHTRRLDQFRWIDAHPDTDAHPDPDTDAHPDNADADRRRRHVQPLSERRVGLRRQWWRLVDLRLALVSSPSVAGSPGCN